MSSNRIRVEDLSSEIMKYLEECKEDINDDVIEISDKLTKEAKNELKQISPKSNKTVKLKGGKTVEPGSYAKSWSVKTGKSYRDLYSKIVYNREHYRLTHILEFGHANRDGSRTKPIPHIRKTEDKYREKFIQELESKRR